MAWCHWKPGITSPLSLCLLLDGLWRSCRRTGKLGHLPVFGLEFFLCVCEIFVWLVGVFFICLVLGFWGGFVCVFVGLFLPSGNWVLSSYFTTEKCSVRSNLSLQIAPYFDKKKLPEWLAFLSMGANYLRSEFLKLRMKRIIGLLFVYLFVCFLSNTDFWMQIVCVEKSTVKKKEILGFPPKHTTLLFRKG